MRIEKIDQTLTESAARVARDEAVLPPANAAPFGRHLTELSEQRFQVYIAQMVEDITQQGKRMAQRADLREFHKYREMIRLLMDEVVSNGYSFNKFRKFDVRGRNKTFALIQKVNAKLEEIANQLLADEADHIALLRSVDDIRGMLVDMML